MINFKKDWVKNKLSELNGDVSEVYDMYPLFVKENNADNWQIDSYKRLVRNCRSKMVANDELDFEEDDYIKSVAQNQKKQDLNNQLRKTNRETFRLYNCVEDVYNEYIELLKKVDLSKFKITNHKEKKNSKTAILQLSDIHANELITPSESFNNEYNFDILSKRMKKFITESMKEFDNNNVSNVLIAMTGDCLNSSRRLSEKLAMNSSLTCASLLLTYILEQVIIELSKKYNISVTCVVGNESRIEQVEMDSQNILATTNYDFLIYNNLRMIFRNEPINFITPKNYIQNVVSLKINKDKVFNALFTHGHILKNCSESNIPSIMQQYMYNQIKIDGIFIGHFHHAQCGDILSVSGCMCGANSYTSNDLKFITRASQNIYIINDDLSYKAIKIDLQNVNGYDGYSIKEELEQYTDLVNIHNNVVTIKNLV